MPRIIPINLNFHVEPEGFFIGKDENLDFRGFEKSYEVVEETRKKFIEQGKSFNVQWLLRLDHQIEKVYGDISWSLRKYEKEINHLNSQGDEIGIHLHSYQWDDSINGWKVDFNDQQFINDLIDRAVEAYRNHFGILPKIFSMGDTWINNATMNHIEDAGLKYELSPIPGRKPKQFPTYKGKFIGAPANYEKIPVKPYHPSRLDFCKADNSRSEGIWVIPLTSANWKGMFYTKDAIKRILRTKKIAGHFMKTDKFQILSGANSNKKTFLERAENNVSHFSFECRTGMCTTEKGVDSFKELVRLFSQGTKGYDFKFTTAMDLVRIYQQNAVTVE